MKSLSFVIKAGAAGMLAALLVVLFIMPEQEQATSQPPEQQAAVPAVAQPATPRQSGPVSYADAVEKAAPSVVNIYTSKTVRQSRRGSLFEQFFGNRSMPRERKQSGLGSGVIFNAKGYIVTNYHVIHEAEDINVSLRDGQHAPAKVVGSDPETDLAILKIDLPNLTAISAGQSDKLRVGDVVLAIGNPFGVGQTVTMGIVSATGRDHIGVNTFENFIQTDAAINPGNSGGALVNAYGDLIGINTAIFSKSGGSDGIGFAIPIDMVKSVLAQIVQHGRVVRGWLGVEAKDIPLHLKTKIPVQGVVITGIFRGGPADKAGLKLGDVVTQINGVNITDTRSLLNNITSNQPGAELHITLWRDGKTIKTMAVLKQRPAIQT